jgi:Holliday junction resolvase-like predicted endonuclease/chaperonin cofactor prefoldin
MAFTVSDFSDLVRLLAEHPEWQAELRRLILTEDLLKLPAIVQDLAEAQRRTEEQVGKLASAVGHLEERVTRLEVAVAELAEAQRRSEERLSRLEAAVAELAEAQRRSEERLSRLEAVVAELAEAQRRGEERMARLEAVVAELAEAQRRTEERVARLEAGMEAMGRFQAALGATIEEEAESVLLTMLEEKGYRLLGEPSTLTLDGEIDIVVPVQDPSGTTLWVIVEVKTRLSRRVVQDWAQRMRSAGWQERLRAVGISGPYMVYIFGIRMDQHTVEAVREQGIGLLTGRGERIPPRDILPALS